MTDKYDDQILWSIGGIEWSESKTSIWRKIGTRINKKHIFDRIDHLESVGFIESQMVQKCRLADGFE